MEFSDALLKMKAGAYIARLGWNGVGMWLGLQVPGGNSEMTMPYIFIKTAGDDLVPWVASQADILASDWIVVDP